MFEAFVGGCLAMIAATMILYIFKNWSKWAYKTFREWLSFNQLDLRKAIIRGYCRNELQFEEIRNYCNDLEDFIKDQTCLNRLLISKIENLSGDQLSKHVEFLGREISTDSNNLQEKMDLMPLKLFNRSSKMLLDSFGKYKHEYIPNPVIVDLNYNPFRENVFSLSKEEPLIGTYFMRDLPKNDTDKSVDSVEELAS